MTGDGFKRKRTAIFSADVKRYSILMGEDEEARKAADEVLKLYPRFSTNNFIQAAPYNDQAVKERLITNLLNAGLPE